MADKNIVIETKDLTKKFGNFTAVDHVNISIEEGTIYGFLGPNGSGKTTTMKLLCGLLTPTSGVGLVLGKDLATEGTQIKKDVGYMSQKFSLYPDMTVIENLRFYSGLYGLVGEEKKTRIRQMLELAGLVGRENELTGNLSGGWRQRLALGCSILHKPKILLLDEPTSGVDPKARRLFWDIIYKLSDEGTTIMVTTHFMDEAEHCDKVAFIYFGGLIAIDSPDKLKQLIPGTLYEIESIEAMNILAKIQAGALGNVMDSYFHGDKCRVLVEEDREIMDNPIFKNAKIEAITPSMEDVFAYMVKAQSSKELKNGRISGTGSLKLKIKDSDRKSDK